jgi:uncharacterized protein
MGPSVKRPSWFTSVNRETLLITVAMVVSIAAPGRSQSAPPNDTSVIQIELTEIVERVPDVAIVKLGITGDAPNEETALTVHYQNLQRILAVIRASGVPAKDIDQQRPHVSPLQETWFEDGWTHHGARIGFRASTDIELTLRDIAHAGSAIQAVIRSGATYVTSISFELTDDHQADAHAAARAKAIVRAEKLATASAKAIGARRVEFISASKPQPADGVADLATPIEPVDKGPPLTIEPGIMRIYEDVHVTFRIVR